MSIKIDGSKAQLHWLSNDGEAGKLTENQGILYVCDKGLGQVTKNTAAGLTPGEAFESRYKGQKSTMLGNWIAEHIFIFDKFNGENYDYDDGVRRLIHDLNEKGRIPFDALHPDFQKENENSEALIDYDREKHLDILMNTIKHYLGLGIFYDTKDPIIWRYQQEEDVQEIHAKLLKHNLCLYAAYTSRGKTKIGIEAAVRLLPTGGIVLVTTPITDTKKSFEDNINDFHFGANRSLKITYMDSKEFAKTNVAALKKRVSAGELIFIVLTVQDARYGDALAPDEVATIREKYEELSGNVDLWIRDERHFQYNGDVTSARLANIIAKYELDLTATPYNVLDKYVWDQIVARTLLWGLKYKNYTMLPTIRIDSISTPFSKISQKLAEIFSAEEGYDPRKLVLRENDNFVLEAELLNLPEMFYYSKLTKKKNSLSIVNDTELDPVAKKCGMWVLPSGQDGDSAGDYIPALAKLLNSRKKDTFFISSYEAEKLCPKNMTIGDYIESLIAKHGRVVILTCGKFLTGTDIPALGHVVLLDKIESIANFEQLLGRMIRVYPGKNSVKMYTLAPGASIGITLGRMAKANTMLSGDQSKKAECEFLDCIPLSEYDLDGKTLKRISPEDILLDVQTWFKDQVRSRLPGRSLEKALYGIDISGWGSVDTSKFKNKTPKTGLTDDTGARVKNKVTMNPKTGVPVTKMDRSKIEQIKEVIQAVIFESQWVAYSIDNYDYAVVLGNVALVQMFGSDIMANVLDAISQDADIESMIRGHFLSKQLAYKNLPAEEVYPEVFGNSAMKQKIGLVYVPFELAKKLVVKIPTAKYYKCKGIYTILVPNALNGTIPLELRKRFPKARIICGECFSYFEEHLKRLGFEVMKWKDISKMKMKFDAVVGNPPYQDSTRSINVKPGAGKGNLYPKFIEEAWSLTTTTGYVGMIIPTSYFSTTQWGEYATKNKFTLGKQINIIETGIERFFNVGTAICYFVGQNTPNVSSPIVNNMAFDISKYKFIPNDTSVLALSILDKITKGPTKFKFIRDRIPVGKCVVFSSLQGAAVTSTGIIKFHDDLKGTIGGIIYHGCRNEKAFKALMSSKVFRFFIKITKINNTIYPGLMNGLVIPPKENLTNAELYLHFKLTPEEIAYVEAHVK